MTIPDGVYVIIPAHNEETVIGDVVKTVMSHQCRVIVVDDGSADKTAGEARRAGATVVPHLLNRGQGAALQTGIQYALERGAQYVVTFDADGQHDAADLETLLQPLVEGDHDVTLGSRFLGGAESIPLRRRWLLRMAVIFTRLTAGIRVTDTHNGFRAFTREGASRIELRLDRMAHASELLDQIRREKLRYREVPVHVRYTAYSRTKGQKGLGALRIVFDYLIGRFTR